MVTDGPRRSILLPAIGPPVAQLPDLSQTLREPVAAFASSLAAAMVVDSEKLASLAVDRPELASLAVHDSDTFAACHCPSATAQTTTGGVVSTTLIPVAPPSAVMSAAV